MTLAISTSSPLVSVALISGVQVLGSEQESTEWAALAAVALLTQRILTANQASMADLTAVAVDVGPGRFTGVRVGVTFGKTVAWALKLPVLTASAFDLVATDETVAIPKRRGEWHVRVPGHPPQNVLSDEPPTGLGYGPGYGQPWHPDAKAFARLLAGLEPLDPFAVVPFYMAEPSISLPKDRRVTMEPS